MPDFFWGSPPLFIPNFLVSLAVMMVIALPLFGQPCPAIMIDAGAYHSLALKDDGTAWAWGRNRFGRLGDGTTNDSNVPVQVLNLNNVSAIGRCRLRTIHKPGAGRLLW